MDHVVGMQISQALKGPVGHSCNLHLLKGLLMHWGVREKHQTEGAQRWAWNKLPLTFPLQLLSSSPFFHLLDKELLTF